MVQERFVFLFQSIMASNTKGNTACLNVNRSNTQLLLFRFQIVPQSFAQTPSTPTVSNYTTQQHHMGKSLPIGVKKPGISASFASTVNNSSHVLKLTKWHFVFLQIFHLLKKKSRQNNCQDCSELQYSVILASWIQFIKKKITQHKPSRKESTNSEVQESNLYFKLFS